MEDYEVIFLIVLLVCIAAALGLFRKFCACDETSEDDDIEEEDLTPPERRQRSRRRGRQPSYRVENERNRPLRPVRPKLDDDDIDINNKIVAMQGNLRGDAVPDKTISKVQNLLLLTADQQLISESCRLIIGVDATPATQAGYCINLQEKLLSYYVIKQQDFPWELHDAKDASEFEMKNFMFALTVWEQEILKGNKRIRIYTDNFAITKTEYFDGKKYGDRAFQVLRHLRNCKGVTVLNISEMAVNRFKNLKQFAKYIKPADDLSRWQINNATRFLMRYYEIDQENVEGTHSQDFSHRRPATAKAWYNPTPRYQEILNLANSKIINCSDCPNPSCSGSTLLQGSLRRNR